MPDDETLALRVTVIGGIRHADDFTVIWRGLPVGRIMRPPDLPPHVPQWRWTCNFYGKPGGGGGAGSDLDDCKMRFRANVGQRQGWPDGSGHRASARCGGIGKWVPRL